MTTLVCPSKIEAIVGAKRQQHSHLGRAVRAEQQVYVLHSVECVEAITARGSDLRACDYSRALDEGIDMGVWAELEDVPVLLTISAEHGHLMPTRMEAP